MILSSKNNKKWISEAINKLNAFLTRAPVLVSFIIGQNNNEDGIYIINEETKEKKWFSFNFDMNEKDWVHSIKLDLLDKYPRIIENIYEDAALTAEEMAMEIEAGTQISQLPKTKKVLKAKNLYRIDKVLIHKNVFILAHIGVWDEKKNKFEEIAPVNQRWKYVNGSCVVFLKKLREGAYENLEKAGEEFFNHVVFVDELIKKEEN